MKKFIQKEKSIGIEKLKNSIEKLSSSHLSFHHLSLAYRVHNTRGGA